jgi:hypothetical protein
MARGSRRGGITHDSFPQPGAAAMILAHHRKNGLTSLVGSISGHRLEATRRMCQHEQ